MADDAEVQKVAERSVRRGNNGRGKERNQLGDSIDRAGLQSGARSVMGASRWSSQSTLRRRDLMYSQYGYRNPKEFYR